MKTKNKPKTPVFQSAKQAAAALGIPIGVINWAKSQGAPGTTGSRIRPEELLPWLDENKPAEGEPIVSKDQAILARIMEQVRDLKRRNNEKERVLVPRAWVIEKMSTACSRFGSSRQMAKDSACIALSGSHGVPVAMARELYDEATAAGGAALKELAAVFAEN